MNQIKHTLDEKLPTYPIPSTNIIGLILGDIRNPYYAEIAYQLQNLCFKKNYILMQFSSSYIEEKEFQFIEFCEHAKFAGLILLSALDSDTLYQKIKKLPFPVILLNRFIPNFNGYTIMQDNFQCGYLAANHLLELGFTKIAFIAGPANSTASMKRLDGFRQALSNCFIPFDPDEIYYGNLALEDGLRIGTEYVKDLPNRPKAVIIGNDMMAIGFMEACQNAHVKIPEQLSIVSFDDIRIASLKNIALTTVRQPIFDMCNATAEALFNSIEHPDLKPYRIILSPELIVRSTTGPCRL